MRILFTGASSFTGYWFVKELIEQGHEVVALLRGVKENYTGLRRERIEALSSKCLLYFEAPFGSDPFLNLIGLYDRWDLFCHHAARVENYRSPQFDVGLAVRENSFNVLTTLEQLKRRGCQHLALTGSVFEPGEGQGSDRLPAVSPYGLSKGLTAQIFQYYANVLNLSVGKFVIPNPFGPFEEERFTSYLAKSWLEGNTPQVRTPEYVRDNVPVTLLAKAYAQFVVTIKDRNGYAQCNPSYYISTQGQFTERFANELRHRFNLPCKFEFLTQTQFTEPKIRTNTQPMDSRSYEWNEIQFWDQLADFYLKSFQSCRNP